MDILSGNSWVNTADNSFVYCLEMGYRYVW